MAETVLAENKVYDHSETKKLLGEVRDFFRKKLLIVPEYTATGTDTGSDEKHALVEAFFIEKGRDPVYQACTGYDSLENTLDLFTVKLNGLLDDLDALQDKNRELDDESRESLECYASAVEKCINVYGTQRRKRAARFREMATVEDLRAELRQLFSEIIGNYIIEVLFDALYERVRNHAGQIYELVIQEVNSFLAEMGVYTQRVSPGEPVDPEYMESTSDSAENFTDDFRKFDTVDEVFRYPYFFSDGAKIMDGRVRIWRRKD